MIEETIDLFIDHAIIDCEHDVLKAMRLLANMTKDIGKQYSLQFYWDGPDKQVKIQEVDLDFTSIKLRSRPKGIK
jgi:hypothetical protein